MQDKEQRQFFNYAIRAVSEGWELTARARQNAIVTMAKTLSDPTASHREKTRAAAAIAALERPIFSLIEAGMKAEADPAPTVVIRQETPAEPAPSHEDQLAGVLAEMKRLGIGIRDDEPAEPEPEPEAEPE